jgi:hypothetical protein
MQARGEAEGTKNEEVERLNVVEVLEEIKWGCGRRMSMS